MQYETDILAYLKTMKFKRALFGLKRTDVLEKIRTLNLMHREIQEELEKQTTAFPLYEKKIEALTKAFVDMQEQAEGIIGQARKQADEMTEAAKEEAATITEQARLSAGQMIAQQQLEIIELSEKRNTMLLELKHVSEVLNQLVNYNIGGETSDNLN